MNRTVNAIFTRRMHVLYLTSGRLDAWLWDGRALSAGPVFQPDRDGVDAFIGYLIECRENLGELPARVLADLVEEDFYRLALPHVRGAAGRRMLQRRLRQHYRETPYRRAELQGRASEGRRDDQVVMSALTIPTLLQPWTEALALVRAPLAGIWSAALLGAALPRKLGFLQPHALLVVRQTAGIRQTYVRDGHLKFSRLAPPGADIAEETQRTRQFLASARLLEADSLLHVVLLDGVAPGAAGEVDAGDVAAVAAVAGATDTGFHAVQLNAAWAAVDPKATVPAAVPDGGAGAADALLLHWLAREQPACHYPTGRDGRPYRVWQARIGLTASSLVLGVAALLWTGANLWRYAQDRVAADTLVEQARYFTRQYRAAMAPVPTPPAPAADMKAAADVSRLLAAQGPGPMPMLARLSTVLERHPQVQLAALTWRVAETDGGAAVGLPAAPGETLRVEAEVHLEGGRRLMPAHARGVVDTVQSFAQDLARDRKLVVAIERAPLELRPDAKLSGKSDLDAAPSAAPFVLNLEQRP